MDLLTEIWAMLTQPGVLFAFGVGSALMFVGSLIVIPQVIALLPSDFFVSERESIADLIRRRHYGHMLLRIGKNIAGLIFIIMGAIMLVLPGQGLLTILAGIVLMDFPGKRALERKIMKTPGVNRATTWIRRRRNLEPFEL